MEERKLGLANQYILSLKYIAARKVTSGVMGQFLARVHIDLGVCYIVVGSAYPGCVEAPKG